MRNEVYEDLDINEDFSMFEFSSVGKRNIILKKILFAPTELKDVYNLTLCDVDADGQLNDAIISNNGDRNKILATVVNVVYKYTQRYPERLIFFTGNSMSRNRLYRMVINSYLNELSALFDIFIWVGDDIMPFTKNAEATSFLIKRKNHNFSL